MTPKEIEAVVDAMAAAMDLPIAAEHRPGVVHYFALAASMAELVNARPVDLHMEPAAVFVPVSPPVTEGPAGEPGA